MFFEIWISKLFFKIFHVPRHVPFTYHVIYFTFHSRSVHVPRDLFSRSIHVPRETCSRSIHVLSRTIYMILVATKGCNL